MKAILGLVLGIVGLAAPSRPCDQGYLGVGLAAAPGGEGLAIDLVVEGSPAAKAGLAVGDRIVRFGGEAVSGDPQAFGAAVRAHKAGETVSVVVVRDGDEKSFDVALAAAPAEVAEVHEGNEEGFLAPMKRDVATANEEAVTSLFAVPDGTFSFALAGESECDRGFLGVKLAPAEDGKGLKIEEIVDGSPAEKAGLKAGDVLLRFDGKKIAGDVAAFTESVRSHASGEKVEVAYLRDGEDAEVEVELGSAPAEAGVFSVGPDGSFGNLEALELDLNELKGGFESDDDAKGAWLGVELNADEDDEVSIATVVPNSPAARAGLKKGDRVLTFKGEDGDEIQETIAECEPGEKVEIKVRRGDDEKEFVVVLGKKGEMLSGGTRGVTVLRPDGQGNVRAQVVRPGRTLRVEPQVRRRIQTDVTPQVRAFRVAPPSASSGESSDLLEEVRALRREVEKLRAEVEKMSSRAR